MARLRARTAPITLCVPSVLSFPRWSFHTLLVAAAISFGCHHDWDELRYTDDSGNGASGGSPSLCRGLCEGYDFCVEPAPIECETVCEAELIGCTGMEEELLAACVSDVTPGFCTIASKAAWDACLAPIPCYQYP